MARRRGRGAEYYFAVGATLLLAAGCGSGGRDPDGATSRREAQWSYRGTGGPAAWGLLAPDYTRCADGSAQSPIAIEHPEDVPLPDLHFDYRTSSAEIWDTGHTEQVTLPPGSSMVLDGATYRLEQLHFHAPSEHSVGRRSFPVEFHFVHRADDGTLSVVAIMAIEGRENSAWQPILRRLPTRRTVSVDALDLSALLPGDVTTTRYEGSLTTPPCSEGVHWILLDAAIELSQRQIAVLNGHYTGNIRPIQPRNGRPLVHDATRGD